MMLVVKVEMLSIAMEVGLLGMEYVTEGWVEGVLNAWMELLMRNEL